jgi:hypothetical protein
MKKSVPPSVVVLVVLVVIGICGFLYVRAPQAVPPAMKDVPTKLDFNHRGMKAQKLKAQEKEAKKDKAQKDKEPSISGSKSGSAEKPIAPTTSD